METARFLDRLAVKRHSFLDDYAFFLRYLLFLFLILPLSVAQAARVDVVRQGNGWALRVDGQPYFVKGVGYSPSKIPEDPSQGTLRDWMINDDNRNGRIDAPYDAFVDANRNNAQDSNEPAVGDFRLMQEMGVNTIRVYHHPSNAPEVQAGYGGSYSTLVQFNHAPNKELLRDLHARYGIRVAMGDFLGAYTIGSGAAWDPGTDYRNAVQRQRMMASVRRMVLDFKDEPFLLFYVLGNENNYGATRTNASQFPVDYARFVEEVVQMIHTLDPNHPVVLCNGDTQLIDVLSQHAPSVDIFGSNMYRGFDFGSAWQQVASVYNKPFLLTEYGNLRAQFIGEDLDEAHQKAIHESCWRDIRANRAGASGQGNAIGGFAYTWLDDWWQDGRPYAHDRGPRDIHNEWHGMAAQGNGERSPYLRRLRLVYGAYQDQWTVKPTTVTGTALGTSSLQWNWNPVPNADDFRVVSADGGFVSPLLSSATLVWTENGLTANAAVTRRVIARNIFTEAASPAVTRFTLAAPPRNVEIGRTTALTLTAFWDSNGNPAGTTYRVAVWDIRGATVTKTVSSASATVTGLSPRTSYFIAVQALNGDGISTEFSASVSTTTRFSTSLPSPPPIFGGTAVTYENGNRVIGWSWRDDQAIEGYRVLSESGENLSGDLFIDTSQWQEEQLAVNTVYVRRLVAFNELGASPPIEARRATHAAPPKELRIVRASSASVSLAWNSNGNPPDTAYVVIARTGLEPQSIDKRVASPEAEITGLRGRTRYIFSVSAINKDGIGTQQESITAETNPIFGGARLIDPAQANVLDFEAPAGRVLVDIQPFTFQNATTVTVQIPSGFPARKGVSLDLVPTGVGAEVTADGPLAGGRSLMLTFSDRTLGSGRFDKQKLVIARYEPERGMWVPLPSTPNLAEDKVSAKIDHLSLFQVMQVSPSASVSRAVVFPNPFRPSAGHSEITFSLLPPETRVRIYTVLGELVYDRAADGLGVARWDGKNQSGEPVGSGVYFVYLQGDSGSEVIKVGVER